MFALKSRVDYLFETLLNMSTNTYPKVIKGQMDNKIIDIVLTIFSDYIEEEITDKNKFELFIKYRFFQLYETNVYSLPPNSPFDIPIYFDVSCFSDDFLKYICENYKAQYFHDYLVDDLLPLYIDLYNYFIIEGKTDLSKYELKTIREKLRYVLLLENLSCYENIGNDENADFHCVNLILQIILLKNNIYKYLPCVYSDRLISMLTYKEVEEYLTKTYKECSEMFYNSNHNPKFKKQSTIKGRKRAIIYGLFIHKYEWVNWAIEKIYHSILETKNPKYRVGSVFYKLIDERVLSGQYLEYLIKEGPKNILEKLLKLLENRDYEKIKKYRVKIYNEKFKINKFREFPMVNYLRGAVEIIKWLSE